MWALLYRVTLPRLRLLPLNAAWGPTVLQRQKAALAEIGFHRSHGSQSGLTDDQAADMFAWLWVTGLVHLLAGTMALPMLWYGYDKIGPTGHLLFFTSTWLTLGWCLFDAVDETARCWARDSAPTGLSGMTCPCPRSFWAATCLMHHPFWFALVLPMNAMLADLPAYHMIIGATVFGTGMQFALRQAALVLGAMGRGMRGLQKVALALHAAFVVVCRGALFFPLCIDIGGHLFEVNGGRSSSELLVGPAILIGCLNIVMILDAIKDSMFCQDPAASQPGRPLHAVDDATAVPHGTPTDERPGSRLHPESQTGRAKPGRSGRAKTKKSKKRGHGEGRGSGTGNGGVENDEEMTFGFASAEFGSSYDNSLEDDNYEDDADDDASMAGDGPAATFRARHSNASSGRNTSPNLRDQPRFDGAGRMPPPTRTSPSCGCGSGRASGGDPTASASARARGGPWDDIESEKTRLRRELEDARRDRRRPAASSTIPPVTPQVVESVDHAAVFASGVAPKKSSHYAMLGVAKSAGAEEIKKAFNKLAMKWHPDKNPSDVVKAELVFMGIKDAYECLSDPIKRRRYDRI